MQLDGVRSIYSPRFLLLLQVPIFLSHRPLSPRGARLFIIISVIHSYSLHRYGLFNLYSTTESLIQKTIEGIQRLISIHNKNLGEKEEEERKLVVMVAPL